MKKKELTFAFDSTDLGAMCALMDKYGKSETMFMGVSTEGEDTTIPIATENIVYVTYQHNGWVRKNIYIKPVSDGIYVTTSERNSFAGSVNYSV